MYPSSKLGYQPGGPPARVGRQAPWPIPPDPVESVRSGAPPPPPPPPSNPSFPRFLYNTRVGVLLITALCSVLSSGGSNTLASASLIGGMMIAYVLDAMRYREGSFLAVWATLLVTNVGLGYGLVVEDSDSGGYPGGGQGALGVVLGVVGRLVMNSGLLFLVGAWATLQYRWIQRQYPAVVVAFEKVLMTGGLPVAGTGLGWGLVGGGGVWMEEGVWLWAGVLCVGYWWFGRPLVSSYGGRNGQGHGHGHGHGHGRRGFTVIQRRSDVALLFLYVLMAPTMTYVAAHNETIFSFLHLWSIVLLFFTPLLVMSAMPKGLWWLGDSAASSAVKRLLVLVSLAGVLAGVEGRIVFHSFGQYIKIAPPFSYIAITLAMYGMASIVLLHVSGMMGDRMALVLLGPILMVSTAIGCLVVGVPVWALPAPLVAAAGVAMYSESRSGRDYALVVLGGLCTAGWFLWHHFWFLDVVLDGMHLRVVCGLVFLALVPAFGIPGLVVSTSSGSSGSSSGMPGLSSGSSSSKGTRTITGVLLAFQAVVIAVLEEHLYAGDYLEVTFDVHPMFPASLVVATSLMGMYVTRRLQERGKIGVKAGFVVECVYGAKVSMIFVPETRLAIPVIAYALASLHPLWVGRNTHRARAISASTAVSMAVAVLLAVAASRFAVFDALHILLDRKPSESVAAGALLVAAAAGWIPMVATYYNAVKASALPKRAVVLVGSLGLLLILLRPPLPIKGGAECPKLPLALCPRLWDASHTPEHEQDDVAVYGDGLRRREHWPLWFVVAASFSGILASTSAIRENVLFAPIRLIQGGVAGLLVGGYMALEFFPGMYQAQVVAVASCVVVAFIVVFLSVPSRGSAVLLPLFGLAWLASLPFALFVLELSSLPPLPADMVRLHPDVAEGFLLDQLRRSTVRTYLISSVAAQSLIISFAGKLRLGGSAGRSASAASPMLGAAADAAYIDKAADFLGGYVSSSVNTRATIGSLAGVNYRKIKAVGMSYLPEVINFVTILCYGLCLWVNREVGGGEHMPAMTLVLSPILLLLSQDSLLFSQLTDRRRYFPVYAMGSFVLGCVSVGDVVGAVVDGTSLSSLSSLSSAFVDVEFLAVNVGAILLSLPSIIEMSNHLWSQQSNRGKVWLAMLTGLAACGLVAGCDVVEESVVTLVGVALVSACVLSASEGERRKRGARVL